ncbi:hypothetical protein ABW19_dt0203349 [Dactylella cylindrospora]|nr:hypothetical protein ABW19_dt0203349 [Dactylella cylindrospora]
MVLRSICLLAYLSILFIIDSTIAQSLQWDRLPPKNDTYMWRDRGSPCANGTFPAGHEFTYSRELGADPLQVCVPLREFDNDGNCIIDPSIRFPTPGGQEGCSSFCEVRSKLYYGREIPLIDNFWVGPGNASINRTTYHLPRAHPDTDMRLPEDELTLKMAAYRHDVLGGPGLPELEDVGRMIDGVPTFLQPPSLMVKLERDEVMVLDTANDCGGSITISPTCDLNNIQTFGHQCIRGYYMRSPGVINAQVTFVRTDCQTKVRKPSFQQNPLYGDKNHQVRMDQDLYEKSFGGAWIDMDKMITNGTWVKEYASHDCPPSRLATVARIDCLIAASEFLLPERMDRMDIGLQVEERESMSRAFGTCLIRGPPVSSDDCSISNQLYVMYIHSLLFQCATASTLPGATGSSVQVWPGKRKLKHPKPDCAPFDIEIVRRELSPEEQGVLDRIRASLPMLVAQEEAGKGMYDSIEDPNAETMGEWSKVPEEDRDIRGTFAQIKYGTLVGEMEDEESTLRAQQEEDERQEEPEPTKVPFRIGGYITGGEDRGAIYFEKLKGLLESYNSIFIVTVDNVSSQQMHEIRVALRGEGVVLMGKNTMVRRVIRTLMGDNPEYERLLPFVKGNVGFVFTNSDLKEIRDKILANKVAAPARPGAVAPVDVWVPAGNTGMEPGKTSFFQALGIPTKIARGTIEITSDLKLIEANNKVGASEATLLNLLNISPFTYGMGVAQIYDQGQVFAPGVLDIEEKDLIERFLTAVKTIASLSLGLNYPTLVSVMHSLVNGYKNVLAVAIETDYDWEEIKELKDRIANPEAYASAAPVAEASAADNAPAAAEEEEEEKEESEDEGFGGLFD